METPLTMDTVETKALRQVRKGVALAGADSELLKPTSGSTLTERLKRAYRREEEMCRSR